jgi:hypothetical protein
MIGLGLGLSRAALPVSPVVRTKMRVYQRATAAATNNSVVNAPWGPLPDWSASTAYRVGAMVKSGGYAYIMSGNSSTGYGASGTSGSTNPFNADPVASGQDRGYITDGTCAWMYRHAAQAQGTLPLVSTVVPAAPTDAMNGYLAVVANSALASLGLTKQVFANTANVNNGDALWYTGGPYSNSGGHVQALGPNAGTVAAPSYAVSQMRPVVAFLATAKWVSFQPYGPLRASANHLFEVDGRLLSEQPFALAADASSSSIVLDLGSFGAGPHLVRVFAHQDIDNSLLRLLTVGPSDTIAAPSKANRYSIAFEGDSITQGGASNPLFNGLDLACQTARLLGCDSWYNNAQGGTGFLADSSGTKTKYLDRLSRITQFAPDILIIGGNHNDATYASADRQAAIVSYVQAVLSALPNCMIFASGGHLLQSDSSSGAAPLALEADMQAAVATVNSSRCVFVPVLTDAAPWITGTGTGYSPQGNGNKDLYYWRVASVFGDPHPASKFYDYVATKYAAVLKSWASG